MFTLLNLFVYGIYIYIYIYISERQWSAKVSTQCIFKVGQWHELPHVGMCRHIVNEHVMCQHILRVQVYTIVIITIIATRVPHCL
jgi:hypothetical protein